MANLKDITNQYKVSLVIIGSCIAVLIIGAIFYTMQIGRTARNEGVPLTPEQEQQNTIKYLRESSPPAPPVSEAEQQKQIIQMKASAKTTVSEKEQQERIRMLQESSGE